MALLEIAANSVEAANGMGIAFHRAFDLAAWRAATLAVGDAPRAGGSADRRTTAADGRVAGSTRVAQQPIDLRPPRALDCPQ